VAARLPAAAGENVIETLQVAFAASVAGAAGQLSLSAKSPGLAPVTDIPLIDSGAAPELVSVTVWAVLVLPSNWEPKARLVGDSDTPGAVPVPDSGALCGLSPALSLTCTLAVREPAAAGAKVTLMVQFAPAARLDGHVLVWAKSPLLAPAIAMLPTDSDALPVLVSRIDRAELVSPTCCDPNATLVGDRVTAGACATPLPDSDTFWGLLAALSATWMAAVRPPAAVGANVAEIVQLPLTASVAGAIGQLLASAKSPAFAPVTEMLDTASGAVPEFVRVTV